MAPDLPQELLDAIVDQLNDLDLDGHAALKACSLVNQAFHLRARKRLFESVRLNPGQYEIEDTGPLSYRVNNDNTYVAFKKLLDLSPDVGSLVRCLSVVDLAGLRSRVETALFAEITPSFSGLETLILRSEDGNGMAWERIPSDRVSAIGRLMARSTTLRSLSLGQIYLTWDVLVLIAQCANLKELEVGRATFLGVYPVAELRALAAPRPQLEVLTVRMAQLPYRQLFWDKASFGAFVEGMVGGEEGGKWADVGHLRRIEFHDSAGSRDVHYESLQRLLDATRKSLCEFRWMKADGGFLWNEMVYTGNGQIDSVNVV